MTKPDWVLIDAASDAAEAVAVATLTHDAPVAVLGLGPGSALGQACLDNGAALLAPKPSGPAAPSLAGDDGAALLARLMALQPADA